MKTYFERPVQVVFRDPNQWSKNLYLGGIAYRDEIICGCCGSVFEIQDLVDIYTCNGAEVIDEEYFRVYEDWVDLNYEIIGN